MPKFTYHEQMANLEHKLGSKARAQGSPLHLASSWKLRATKRDANICCGAKYAVEVGVLGKGL